jgi:hypothetical protein
MLALPSKGTSATLYQNVHDKHIVHIPKGYHPCYAPRARYAAAARDIRDGKMVNLRNVLQKVWKRAGDGWVFPDVDQQTQYLKGRFANYELWTSQTDSRTESAYPIKIDTCFQDTRIEGVASDMFVSVGAIITPMTDDAIRIQQKSDSGRELDWKFRPSNEQEIKAYYAWCGSEYDQAAIAAAVRHGRSYPKNAANRAQLENVPRDQLDHWMGELKMDSLQYRRPERPLITEVLSNAKTSQR